MKVNKSVLSIDIKLFLILPRLKILYYFYLPFIPEIHNLSCSESDPDNSLSYTRVQDRPTYFLEFLALVAHHNQVTLEQLIYVTCCKNHKRMRITTRDFNMSFKTSVSISKFCICLLANFEFNGVLTYLKGITYINLYAVHFSASFTITLCY